MDLFKYKFLFAPLLILFLLFLADKFFLLPAVLEHTLLWQKIEPPFYESRYQLFEQLQNEYPARTARGEKLGLVLGTSRTGEFNNEHLSRILPGTYTYNFSAPLAAPSYLYYWLDRVLKAGMRPEFAIVETGPILFGKNAIRYSLSYSYDSLFVLRHTDLNRSVPVDVWGVEGRGFGFDEAETFFLKRLFALYKYPFDPSVIRKNNEEMVLPNSQLGFQAITGREFKKQMLETIAGANRRFLGGIPNPLALAVPPGRMEADAENLIRLHLQNPRPDATQVLFFKKLVLRLAKQGVPTLLYWPLTSEPFRRKLDERNLIAPMQAKISKLLVAARGLYPQARLELVDLYLDPEMRCRVFVDAHHLSGVCYDELADFLAARLLR